MTKLTVFLFLFALPVVVAWLNLKYEPAVKVIAVGETSIEAKYVVVGDYNAERDGPFEGSVWTKCVVEDGCKNARKHFDNPENGTVFTLTGLSPGTWYTTQYLFKNRQVLTGRYATNVNKTRKPGQVGSTIPVHVESFSWPDQTTFRAEISVTQEPMEFYVVAMLKVPTERRGYKFERKVFSYNNRLIKQEANSPAGKFNVDFRFPNPGQAELPFKFCFDWGLYNPGFNRIAWAGTNWVGMNCTSISGRE